VGERAGASVRAWNPANRHRPAFSAASASRLPQKLICSLAPAAAGNVLFKLWSTNTLGVCSGELFSATVATNAAGVATTSTTVTTAGTYYWTADFTPTDPGAFNPSASTCGSEIVTVVAPTVS